MNARAGDEPLAPPQAKRRVRHSGREEPDIADDVADEAFSLAEIAERVAAEIRARPFAALAVAFGAGVAASHAFSSKLARVALVAAGGLAARELLGPRLIEVLREESEGLLERVTEGAQSVRGVNDGSARNQ
jgi:hypothetical protein